MKQGQLVLLPVENHYQAQTTPSKLRGQYYTPKELVRMVLGALDVGPSDLIVDPSCGDGNFLRGAVSAATRTLNEQDPHSFAVHLAKRLIGFDTNGSALDGARSVLRDAFRQDLGVEISPASFHLYQADSLQHPHLCRLLEAVGYPPLHVTDRLLVVGNPPYVEAKRLPRETKAVLKALYPEAVTGAPDLYLYFLHVCLGWLRDEKDALAFVLPNKLLVNANAQTIRERLLEEGCLGRLWFATQANIFPDASVYPIVLFATGKNGLGRTSLEVARITRDNDNGLVRGDSLPVLAASYSRTTARAFFPPPQSAVLRAALDQLLVQRGVARLDDVLDIRWSVSFHRLGLRERYVTPVAPASPHRHRFLGGGAFAGNGEVVRYSLKWAGWWIDYDEDRLRRDGNCVPPVSLFQQAKIVVCQNGRTLRAAYDDEGFVLKDTFLCGVLREGEHPLLRHPRAVVGLLCSRAVHFFYSHVFYGGHVNGGYLHFLRSFLVDVPVGMWTETRASEVAALVACREALGAASEVAQIEEQIEQTVSEALSLSQQEQLAICAWASSDPNWRARDRVRRGSNPPGEGAEYR
jgi:hypothetical protein